MGRLNRFIQDAGAVFADSLSNLQSLERDWGAAVVGNPTIVASPFGPALKFDGTDDAINLGTGPQRPALQFQRDDAWSVSFWFFMDATAAAVKSFVGCLDDASFDGWEVVREADGTIRCALYSTGSAKYQVNTVSATLAEAGKWIHMVVTKGTGGATDFRVYINGSVVSMGTPSSDDAGSSIVYTSAQFTVADRKAGGVGITGRISNLFVWDRKLTTEEVDALAHHRWYDWTWKGGGDQFKVDFKKDAIADLSGGQPAALDASVKTVSANSSYHPRTAAPNRLVPATVDVPRIERTGVILEQTTIKRGSEDLEAWSPQTNVVVAPVIEDDTLDLRGPNGDFDASKCTFPTVAASPEQSRIIASLSHVGNNGSLSATFYARVLSGTLTVRWGMVSHNQTFMASFDMDLTDQWQEIQAVAGGKRYHVFGADFVKFGASSAYTVYIWRPQGESPLFAPTSYIPMPSLTQRDAENIQYTNASEVNLPAAEWSLAFVVTPMFDGINLLSDSYVFDISDGTNGVRAFFGQSNSGKLTVEVLSGGGVVATLVALASPLKDVSYSVVCGGEVDNFFLSIDGVEQATQGSPAAAPVTMGPTIFTGQDRLLGLHLNGNLALVKSWNRVLNVRERVVLDIEQRVSIARMAS